MAAKSVQSIASKLLSRIHGHGRGWAFSANDFVVEFNSKNLHNSISKAELNEQIRVLRSHNHKMGFDRPEYQSETHSKFSKPKHCADSVQKSNISTAELQQSHYKFGSDSSK